MVSVRSNWNGLRTRDGTEPCVLFRLPLLNVGIEYLTFRPPGVAVNDYGPRSCSLQKGS